MSKIDRMRYPTPTESLMGYLVNAQTSVANLKTELIAYAYHEEASPFMRRAILSSLAHAGLFNGDVEAEVGKHPNFTTTRTWLSDGRGSDF